MADDGGDLIANFLAITGADEGVAIQCLEAANFNLEEAVNLFFAADGSFGGGGAGGAGAGGGRGGAGAGGHGGGLDEDEVRAPLPTKVERLYGDDQQFDPRAMSAALQARHQGLAGRPAHPHVDVIRDIRAETAAAAAAAAAGGASGAASAAAPAPQGLSGLFKLPEDLVYAGTAEMARAQAAAEGRWLLVNVQSATEFASHCLNRDTWSHEALKEILKGTFVFYQTQESSTDGRALVKAYRLDGLAPPGGPTCPATFVVDPVTGAQLWHRAGFVDAEKLMEELVPFMDHGPLDAGAAGIAQINMKRKVASSTAVAAAAAAAAAAGGAAGGGAGGGRKAMTEDEELALAIAMSMERGGDGAGPSGITDTGDDSAAVAGAADSDGDDDGLDEAAIWAQIQAKERAEAAAAAAAEAASNRKSPEEVAAEALARVPEEPAEGDPQALRVALRLPDGSRLMRRFRKSEHVRCLYDLATAKVPEAAAGRSVTISHATPGGAALTDQDQSLEAAGVAGAMLAVKLGD